MRREVALTQGIIPVMRRELSLKQQYRIFALFCSCTQRRDHTHTFKRLLHDGMKENIEEANEGYPNADFMTAFPLRRQSQIQSKPSPLKLFGLMPVFKTPIFV